MRQHKDCAGFLIDGFPRDIQQGLQFEQEVSLLWCLVMLHVRSVNLLDHVSTCIIHFQLNSVF